MACAESSTRTKVKRLENWENEGGPAFEDDI